MTKQETIEIRELKRGQEKILDSQESFQDEVRIEIETIKTMIATDYIPKKYLTTTSNVFKWIIATVIGAAGVLVLWYHKGK